MADSSGDTAREQWLGRRRREKHWEKRVIVGSVWMCWCLGVGTACGCVLCGCGVFMFHLSSNIRDRGLYVWAANVWAVIGNSLCVAVCVYPPSQLKHYRQGSLCLSCDREQSVCGCVLCGCVCVCSISAQAFETGVFMFELSWSKACGCVAPCPNPSHSVPTL